MNSTLIPICQYDTAGVQINSEDSNPRNFNGTVVFLTVILVVFHPLYDVSVGGAVESESHRCFHE